MNRLLSLEIIRSSWWPVFYLATLFSILSSVSLPAQQTEKAKLVAADGMDYDWLGSSVAVSGDYAVVGAHKDDIQDTNEGSAYVYWFNGVYWEEQQKLIASDGENLDWFGYSVAISDNFIMVGAPKEKDSGQVQRGAVYVFELTGSSWNEVDKITPDVGEGFGHSIAMSSGVAIIGAPYGDGNDTSSGVVYIYRNLSGNWIKEQRIWASDGAYGDDYGGAVAISGDRIVVGAYEDEDFGPLTGSVYTYSFGGSQWSGERKLLASDGNSFDRFGESVAISGEVIVVGAKSKERGVFYWPGTAYVFRRSGSSWQEEQRLLSSDLWEFDYFGASVAINGDTVAIGCPMDDDSAGQGGSVYLFQFDGNSWNEDRKLLASDAGGGDELGWAVALTSEWILTGSHLHDVQGTEAGAAYLFELIPTPPAPFELAVTPYPLQGGQIGTFEVTGGTPSEIAWLIYSLDGGSCAEFIPALNVIVDVCDPYGQVGNPLQQGMTDAGGQVRWDFIIPGVGATQSIWFQAVQKNRVTPVVATSILP